MELLNFCLVPMAIVSPSPSCQDGIDRTTEDLHRVFGCECIQESGILLKLPQVVSVTAQNMFHRFYYRKSLLRFDVFTVAMGCVLLAAKVEEKIKCLREIIFVFHDMHLRRTRMKRNTLELGGEIYLEWKNELMTMERYILKELGFAFYQILDHPHKFVLYVVKLLDGDNNLAQLSWNYLNDCMRRDFCCRYRSEYLATAAVHLAACRLQLVLPDNWWQLITDDWSAIEIICDGILSLFEQQQAVSWLESLTQVEYLSKTRCACTLLASPAVTARCTPADHQDDDDNSHYSSHQTRNVCRKDDTHDSDDDIPHTRQPEQHRRNDSDGDNSRHSHGKRSGSHRHGHRSSSRDDRTRREREKHGERSTGRSSRQIHRSRSRSKSKNKY